ncbi:hypothetical protein I3842_01G119000 [Carya illinoinensis]|uniref:Uncharacterized protein n=1 Tax=Carya illinoinensis TaxID=32201 RepID=A0A922G4N7_CARIL|nr:hypothetical protein I3842_01G119000 [Carya illinoinensis]
MASLCFVVMVVECLWSWSCWICLNFLLHLVRFTLRDEKDLPMV